MKQIQSQLQHLLTLAFALLFLSACNPCEDITCQNGGTCEKGVCACPPQYWGPFCGEEKPPASVVIQSVILGSFRSANSSGFPWDIGSYPDVYLEFYQNNQLLGITNLLEDEQPGRTRTFSGGDLPINLDPDQLLQIRVMDYDGPTERELIFFEYIDPYSRGDGFPEQLIGAGMSINISYNHDD